MKESLLILLIFLLGCSGLLGIFLSGQTSTENKTGDILHHRITNIVPSSEAGCVQIDINLQTNLESPIQIDYGNGIKEVYDGFPLIARYQNPGVYMVRAYQNGELVEMNECQITGQSL